MSVSIRAVAVGMQRRQFLKEKLHKYLLRVCQLVVCVCVCMSVCVCEYLHAHM